MAQQTINAGPPYTGAGDLLPVGWSKTNSNFNELYATTTGLVTQTVLAYTYPGNTIEQQIQNAINDAATRGIRRCFLSGTMVPFDPSLVTFNPAVQMIWEYGPTDKWDVTAYGARGDGVASPNELLAINAADAGCTAGGTVVFGPGKTYALPTISATSTLLAKNAQTWDLNGSTIKYTGVANVTTGSDGAYIPMVSVLRAPFVIRFGVIDGNSHVAAAVAYEGDLTGPFLVEFLTIQNLLEPGTWSGIAYAISKDVSGVTVTGARAQNVSGFIARPNCPLMDNNQTITGHSNCSAIIVGGSSIWGNATGMAIVNGGGGESTQVIITNGAKAVPQFLSKSGTSIVNTVFLDLQCYDMGARHMERYGAVLDYPQRQTFGVGGGTYTPGWLDNSGGSDAINHIITVSANGAGDGVQIANPTNPAGITVDRVGRLRFKILNTSVGSLSTPVNFSGTKYRMSGTVSPGSNQQITVEVLWDQTSDTYAESFRSAAVAI